MRPERWEQVKQLFHAALEQEASQRPDFLARMCVDDKPLREEVQSLLESHEQAQSFIETPASDLAAGLLAEDHKGLVAGLMVNHFRIVGSLGAGGMGEVYLADDTRLGRRIALKLLPAQFTINPERVRRFEQEARTASALNHPNILTVYETGQFEDRNYIAVEFVEGQTLREHMANTRMTIDEVLDVIVQVAAALQAAHEAGIVHRDVKPENIMLRRDRIVKVVDFGLAKLATQQSEVEIAGPGKSTVKTNPGMVIGTVGYMSPEQARGAEVDVRTDVWSLGVVLYELLSGRTPFVGETPSHVIVSILESEPLPLADVAKAPAGLDHIVSKALRKQKSERYQSVREMAIDLNSLNEEQKAQSRTRTGGPDATHGGAESKQDGGAALNTAHASPMRTADLAFARTVSSLISAEYLVKALKRHKRGAVFSSATVVLMIAFVVYSNFNKRSVAAIDSVAVLLFSNVSNDPKTEYISEGISDSIINSLSHLPNLKVRSLTSVLRYKGTQPDPQTVARELSVQAVLMGRMTQEGDDLTISAELVDVRDNSRMWSGRYNRKKSDVVVLPNEIAREIAERLRLRLSDEQRQQLAERNTDNSDAYLLYNLGKYYGRKGTKEGWEKAIASYEEALKIDPNFALAYVALAGTYQFMASRGFGPTKEYVKNVEFAALKALQLDETLAAAHGYLGVVRFNNFDWVGAEKEIKRALELDPSSSIANSSYAFYLTAIGRADEGLVYGVRSRELDPSPDRGENAFDYYMARQYDKAIELYKKALEKKPDNPHAHVLLGEAYLAKGMLADGVAEMQRGIALDSGLSQTPERWDRYPLLAYAYGLVGQRDEALKLLSDQMELAKQRYVSPYNFAIIYTGLGDKDRAFEWLSKCVEERTRVLSFHFKSRPLFDPLRSDPRYTDILRRMNLEP